MGRSPWRREGWEPPAAPTVVAVTFGIRLTVSLGDRPGKGRCAVELALAKLVELRDKGFRFMHLRDEAGQLDRIIGFKQVRGFVDSILFWSETEARAGRVPAVRD